MCGFGAGVKFVWTIHLCMHIIIRDHPAHIKTANLLTHSCTHTRTHKPFTHIHAHIVRSVDVADGGAA